MIQELRGKYRPFSNFWSCFINYDGDWYPSVENAYQAAKMKNKEDRKLFFYCKASEAKQLGRIHPMLETWDDLAPDTRLETQMLVPVKVSIMYNFVFQKFNSDSFLKGLLISTGTEEIQEGNWWGDTFWGTVNGKGENWLGRILMKVREELKNQE